MADSAPLADVAIIGYGPTGAILANLLGQAGCSVAVFERDAAISELPRAIAFDGEVMRIFETAGLAEQLLPSLRPSGRIAHLNAAGELLVERRPIPGVGPHGWGNNWLFHQPELESVLRSGAARFSHVSVFPSYEVVAITQDAERAQLEIRAPDGSRRTVGARYAIGCDGGRSLMRSVIGTALDDLGLHQPWLVVDIELQRDVALPEHTVQYCDPARPMTYVRGTGNKRRWEIMLMPGDDPVSIMAPESVWRILSRWVSPRDGRLARGAVYTFHSLIARRWREGRLFIAGDAAHQTPPFLGQGMCAGIRDAANLAWKLALVLRGEASPRLLDTYGAEREPHVRVFIEEAMRLGAIIQTTDPEVAAHRDQRFREGGAEEVPHLSPSLGPGLHTGAAPAGTIFPQPTLDDGRRLDRAIDAGRASARFALVAAPTLVDALDAHQCAILHRLDAAIVPAGAAAGHWLASHRAAGVLLRPDRYVLDLLFEPTDLLRVAALADDYGLAAR